MKINSIPTFKGLGLSPVSNALYTLSNNDMLNASFVDIFAMDTPRTLVEYKNRGKNAGREMAFREYTGTFIAEFSAAIFALIASKIFAKSYKPDIKINSKSWATNSSIDTFNEIYKSSNKTQEGFIKDTLEAISAVSGNKRVNFSDIGKNEKEEIAKNLSDFISNKGSKQELKNIEDSIIQALKADNNMTLKKSSYEFNSNLSHMLRDMVDLSKNVFFKEGADIESTLLKLKTMNKSRIGFAIPLSMIIALLNQFINRKITKKKTGIDNFVGENDYEKNVENKKEKNKQKGLWWKKLLSAGVFLFMLSKVMNIKKPMDLINKLEFTGPATGGNAIKTVYGSLILGRIFASKDTTELRETDVRDYLGFLNWLVLGGFVAKGAAQIMDKNQSSLFNISKEGKGIKHWLSDLSLKSQKEIIAQGGDVAENLKKLNIAQMAGIAYSAVMLGVLLPKLNIWMTRHGKDNSNKNVDKNTQIEYSKIYTPYWKQGKN